MKRVLSIVIGIALPALAAAAVAWPGLSAWYVADDFMHIPYMTFLETPWRFWDRPLYASAIFRPLNWTIVWYQNQAFGLAPEILHLTNLVHQGLNIALVFALATILFGRRPGDPEGESSVGTFAPALAATLVFAVHPVSALTTAWFACRGDLMATTFSLLTLIIIASRPRPGRGALILSGITTFLALAAKDTHLPLFLAVFVLAFTRQPPGRWRERLRSAGIATLPAINATVINICWRLLVMHSIGGYDQAASSPRAFAGQLAYHLPAVGRAAVRDFTIHHMPAGDPLFNPLAICGAALLVLGGVGALARRRPVLWFALGLVVAGLVPVWNLSHMLVSREERLMYFPLVGFVLAVGALVAGPRRWWLRWAGLAAVVFASAGYALISWQAVGDWRAGAQHTRKQVMAAAAYLESFGPRSQVMRVYALGLGPDSYNFDAMVRLELDKSYWDREVVPGDRDSFIMMGSKAHAMHTPPRGVVATAVPSKKVHETQPGLVFETITPPDLMEAAAFDRGARVVEWNGSKFIDLTEQLKERYMVRFTRQSESRNNQWILPSFSLVKSPLPFVWTAGPGLDIAEPLFAGNPSTYTSPGNDPYLLSPPLMVPALWVTHLDIEMRIPKRAYLPPNESQGCISWETQNHPAYSPEQSICFPIRADGEIHSYLVPVAVNVYWSRAAFITRLRIDPISYPGSFQLYRVEFRSI